MDEVITGGVSGMTQVVEVVGSMFTNCEFSKKRSFTATRHTEITGYHLNTSDISFASAFSIRAYFCVEIHSQSLTAYTHLRHL